MLTPASWLGKNGRKGQEIMRCVYLDDAGLGDEKHEPITVVAAVMVHPDQQWRQIEAEIDQIVEKLVPPQSQKKFQPFEFHAKELFSGSHKVPWGKQTRHAVFKAFLEVFPKYRLPILTGRSVRAEIRQMLSKDGRKIKQSLVDLATLNFAFLEAIQRVNFVMRHLTPKEVAICFSDEMLFQREDWLRTTLGFFHRYTLSGNTADQLEHLVDTLYFASSHESTGLQLADAAAFLFKRHLMKKQDSEPFYKIIEPCVMLAAQP